MGYYGRLELKLAAQKMRQKGHSYKEIVESLGIPKTTVSDWCKDIILTKDQLNRLYQSKKSGALKGSAIASMNKRRLRLDQIQYLFSEGKKEVGLLTKRDRFVAGIAFYASEGTKVDKGCAFANSDPKLISFMVRWFKEFGEVPIEKFRAALWIHEELNERKAKEFWSKTTGLSVDQFYKSYRVKNKSESRKIRKKLHEFGVITLYVSNVVLGRKIMGWIGGVTKP
jgi:hypothetical protein